MIFKTFMTKGSKNKLQALRIAYNKPFIWDYIKSYEKGKIMEDKVAFRKGEYDFDHQYGHVHVSVPRDIYVSKIQQPFIKLLQEANRDKEDDQTNYNNEKVQ